MGNEEWIWLQECNKVLNALMEPIADVEIDELKDTAYWLMKSPKDSALHAIGAMAERACHIRERKRG